MAHNARAHCGPIQAKRRKEKYAAQFAKTLANRRRKQAKHQRFVEKKKARKGLF